MKITPYHPRLTSSFIGRKQQLQKLKEISEQKEAAIIIIYGRRRVGKTELIEQAYKERNLIKIEGIEGQDELYQMQSALSQIARYTNNPMHSQLHLNSPSGKPTWNNVFELLHDMTKDGVWTLYFEELQWLANYQDTFTSELKYYWDNFYRHNAKLRIVLCGSSPSFMINQVVKSKSLYNRSQHEIPLHELNFQEAREFLNESNHIEPLDTKQAMEAYLTVGGIPEYLKYLKQRSSIYQAICDASFKTGSFFASEWDRIFVSSFSNNPDYKAIIEFLAKRKFSTRDEILKSIKKKSGGAISEVLEDLELCGFIERYFPYDAEASTRLARYAIADYYIQYYVKFIKPKLRAIRAGDFEEDSFAALNINNFKKWQGYAFERFCRKNHRRIAKALGFSAVDYRHGPFFNRSTSKAHPGYQIDLVYDRADKTLSLCEIKFTEVPASVSVGREFEKKLQLFKTKHVRRIERVLISAAGATKELRGGGYFDRILSFDDELMLN